VIDKKLQEIAELVDKGIKLCLAEKYEEALSSYFKALEIDQNNVHVLNSIAGSFFPIGKYDEALKFCKKVLEIDPDNMIGLIGMGNILAAQKNYDEAIKNLDKALKLEPNNLTPYFLKVKTLHDSGKYEDAANWYGEMLGDSKEHQPANKQVILAMAKLGKFEEAMNYCDRLLVTDPTNSKVKFAKIILGGIIDLMSEERCSKCGRLPKNHWKVGHPYENTGNVLETFIERASDREYC